MYKTLMALAATGLLATSAQAHPADPAPVIAAERAFSARAAVVGIAPSFLEYMTDDAIVFSPGPVNAKTVYGGHPPPKTPKDGGTLLAWWPNYAGIARSGDLGFTTGPATINAGKPGVFYFTVWQRQASGGWKWIYDGGIDADGTAAPGPAVAPIALPPGDAKPLSPAVALTQVKAAEAALAARAKTDSAGAVIAALAPLARVQGSTHMPVNGLTAAGRELATRAKAIDFSPLGGGASRAGDLVWTYGDARWEGRTGSYVRVWQRRGGGWKIVFDQIVEAPPVPPPAPAKS